MNSSNQLKVVGTQGVLSKKIITQKEFSFKGLEWQYQNKFDLSLNPCDYSMKLRVKNHLCQMTGNTIKKTTQILHKNQQYSIQDSYSLHIPPNSTLARETKDATSTNDSDNKNEGKQQLDDKKIYIFKKSKKQKGQKNKSTETLRNTKNVSKNFCKAFISYLRSNKITGISRNRIKDGILTYERLFEKNKYNNRLIKKMIANEILRDLFRIFLEKEAVNWINQSRISDKHLHEEAISVYLNLFESMNLVDRRYDSDSEILEEDRDSSQQQSK